MKLLKMKMSTAPKRQVPPKQGNTGQRFTHQFDIENQMGGGGSMNQSKPSYGGNKITQSRPVAKKPMNQGYSNNYGGGMMNSSPLGGGGGMSEDMYPDENEPTYPCPDCGRSFNQKALAKHKKICKKVFQKKRKAFNMTKQRMVDGEQMSLMKISQKYAQPKKQTGGAPKWKKQSEEFRNILKANRGVSFNNIGNSYGGNSYGRGSTQSRGRKIGGSTMSSMKGKIGGMPSFTPSVINDDFTLCKFCNRRYNDEAYHKHLAGCERRYNEAQIRNKIQKKPGNNRFGKK